MGVLARDPTLRRQVGDLRARLRTFVDGEASTLPWLGPALVEATGAEAAGLYDLRFGSDRIRLGQLDQIGFGPSATVRSLFDPVVGALPRPFANWSPLRPAARDRNVVIGARVPRIVDQRTPPIVAAVYAPLGLKGAAQYRVVLADGPTFLGYLAILTRDTFTTAAPALLRAILPALRRRLVLHRLIDGAMIATHALAATLEAIPRPALLVRAGGTIRHLNSAAVAWLADGRVEGAAAIRASLARRPTAPFAVFPVRARGVPPHYLLVHRCLPAGEPLPVAEAVGRWRLSPRQAAVLRLLARGCANRSIAAALDLAENTVEHHVTRLLHRAGVDSRAALVARLWGGR